MYFNVVFHIDYLVEILLITLNHKLVVSFLNDDWLDIIIISHDYI